MRVSGVLLLLFFLFSLTGCNNKIKVGNFNEDLVDLRVTASLTCKDKGMAYAGMETLEYDNYQALCYTTSPVKIYRFKVET